MKYQKYLVLTFVTALFLPLLSAKSVEVTPKELNLDGVNYLEMEESIQLDFDSKMYLPEDFDPYGQEMSLQSLNYVEEDAVDLGFETEAYLPENFDPYAK